MNFERFHHQNQFFSGWLKRFLSGDGSCVDHGANRRAAAELQFIFMQMAIAQRGINAKFGQQPAFLFDAINLRR